MSCPCCTVYGPGPVEWWKPQLTPVINLTDEQKAKIRKAFDEAGLGLEERRVDDSQGLDVATSEPPSESRVGERESDFEPEFD